jgi:hypothetical protein
MFKAIFKQKYPWYIDIILITIFLSVLFFIYLGSRPLLVPDGGRYAEIAREMLVKHDYVTPYLNGILYFEKPVLYYWLEVAAIKIGGLNLWSLRSINALLGIIACLATYGISRFLYNRTTALLASVILSLSCLYFAMIHIVNLDLAVSVWISLCLYAILLSVNSPKPHQQRLLMGLAACFAALAVLTKGLIGVVLPSLIIGLWLTISQQWSLIKRMHILSAMLIFLLIAAPWHIMIAIKHPEFLHFYFIEQHFLRYSTKMIGHNQPAWYYLPVLIASFCPWIVFLPQTWKALKFDNSELLLVIWALVVFVFFSFSHSKLIPYILPMLPPMAILTAHYLASLWTVSKCPRSFKISIFILFIASLFIAYIDVHYCQLYPTLDAHQANYFLTMAAISILLGMSITLFVAWRYQAKMAIICLSISWAIFYIFTLGSIQWLDMRSIYTLATQIKPLLKPKDEIVSYKIYYQDLPFYLQKQITIVNWRNELSFGMQYQPEQNWLISTSEFLKRINAGKHLVIVTNKDDAQALQPLVKTKQLFIVTELGNRMVLSNQPMDK